MKIGDIFYGNYGKIRVLSINTKARRNANELCTFVNYEYISNMNGGELLNKGGGCFIDTFNKAFKKQVKATRLARKLYPDAEVSECGEWIYV